MADDSAIFAALPDGAILLDAAGAILAVNPAAARLLAIEPADWLGRADAPFVPAEPQERLAWDGRVFSVRLAPVGESGGFLALYADISIQIEAEKDIDLFMACLFSDMRSPSTTMINYGRILAQGHLGPLNDNQRRAAETIERSGEAGQEKIWAYSDIYGFDPERLIRRFEQHNIIEHIGEITQGINRKLAFWNAPPINVLIEHEDAPTILTYDRHLIEEALLLILNTAASHSTSEKRIRLRLRAASPSSLLIDVPVRVSPAYDMDAPRLFKRFAPPHWNDRINFYLARAYVEAHGGQLWVESGAQGTAFCFTLPIQPAASLGA